MSEHENRVVRGRKAEESALHYLESKGMRLVVRNFRTRRGEIDLIMQDGKELVFVEVRSRSSQAFGSPAETVSASKQAKIRKTALFFLQQRHLLETPCRFDVVGVLSLPKSAASPPAPGSQPCRNGYADKQGQGEQGGQGEQREEFIEHIVQAFY